MSDFIRYESCPDCGSKDNVGVWRGRGGKEKKYCFSCREVKERDGSVVGKKVSWPLRLYGHSSIDWRRITKSTALKYDILRAGKIVAFPLYWNNTVTGIKYRDFLFDKSEKDVHMMIVGTYANHFFGWQAVHTPKTIAIALGEFDAPATFQATGVPCLSPPNGDGSLVQCVKNDYERLAKFERIVFLPDRDKRNNHAVIQPSMAVAESIKILGEDRCYVANLTLDDPNEYLMQNQSALLKRAFWSAEPSTGSLFYPSTSELISPTQMGIVTGLDALDRKLRGLRAEEVTYILGAPSQGKTTFTQYLMWLLANRGVKMCSIILEGGHKKFTTKLANTFAGGNYYLLDENKTRKVNQHIDSHVMTARVNSGATIKEIENTIKAAVKVHGTKIVVVDNITAAGNVDKFFESTSEFVYMFDRLATELQAHFLVISHVGRAGYNEPPTMGSGLGSGMIERVAFNIIGVFRERGKPISRIEILKNREIGLPGEGVFNLEYDIKTSRYKEGTRICQTI